MVAGLSDSNTLKGCAHWHFAYNTDLCGSDVANEHTWKGLKKQRKSLLCQEISLSLV
jgi:hypothetical protein